MGLNNLLAVKSIEMRLSNAYCCVIEDVEFIKDSLKSGNICKEQALDLLRATYGDFRDQLYRVKSQDRELFEQVKDRYSKTLASVSRYIGSLENKLSV